MVAVVSGNSLGLSLSSMLTLGQRGALGQAAQGRSGEQVYVNAATGNLVVQRVDDLVASRGLDLALTRTYNSQGLASDDNRDNWQLGVYKRLALGSVTRAGGTITRTDGDGARAIYTWDGTTRLYRTTGGEGAFDTVEARGRNWIWTDGASGVTETYDSSGRLLSASDIDGNTTAYAYDANGLLGSVTDASGDSVRLVYSGNNLQRLTVSYTDAAGAHAQVRTSYRYDALDRLAEVTTDLSVDTPFGPNDQSYSTRYDYDGASTRIAHMQQSDRSALAFTYVQVDGTYRVATVTDGEGRTTGYSYGAGTTTVTDPLGNATLLSYDAQGQLLQVRSPAVDGSVRVVRYEYNANGDLVSASDGRNTMAMRYDANGNQIEQRDAAGNTVRRAFSTSNRLLRETVYTVPDPNGAGAAEPLGALSTRYVYDNRDHLRFIVSPQGGVTEYRYNGFGERETEIHYSANTFDVSPLAPTDLLDYATVQTWATAATTDRSAALRTDYIYTLGRVTTATTYEQLAPNGEPARNGAQPAVTSYGYSISGRVLQTTNANGKQSSFAYDGLDRVVASTDADRNVTATVYDDGGARTTVRLANGLWTTSSYDRAGELVSVTQSAEGGAPLGTTRYAYDAAGRLRMETDATQRRSWHLYDAAGRRVADVAADGALIEYRYNAANQLARTIRYATAVDVGLLVDAAGNPTGVDIAALRPAPSAADRSTWTVYDAAGRAVQTIDGEGDVRETEYDGASRVVRVIAFAQRLTELPAGDAIERVAAGGSSDDRVSRNFYDADGHLTGALDAEGYLTVYGYDAAGQRVSARSYATPTSAGLRATASLAELTPQAAGDDIRQLFFYDRRGRLAGTVDGENFVTERTYDLGGNLVGKRRYATRVTVGADLAATRPVQSGEDQIWRYGYTALNQLTSETAPDGTVTRYVYDNVGNLVQTTRGWQSDDARSATRRYDVQGRLVAELDGEGSARLALATTPAAIDAVWAGYARHYGYDAAGRRIATTDANGNRTLHYYDAEGRAVAEINAAGEVATRSYDPLGNLASTRRYAARVGAAALATLSGGDADTLTGLLGALADGAADSVTTSFYDRAGQRTRSVDALGFASEFDFTAFGEVRQKREQIAAGSALRTDYRYDHRGLRTETLADPQGLAVRETASYDAFGRLVDTVDANQHTTTRGYDRLGRMVSLHLPIGGSTTEYDPFDRVTLQTDATGRATRTTYDTANRTVTVTLPDGVSMTTTYNRHGDRVSFSDGRRQPTTYRYDASGRLREMHAGSQLVERNEWDNAGNRTSTIDANGVITTYSYDAANRVLVQTVDPDGLNLRTDYSYDSAGRVLRVTQPPRSATDPRRSVTETAYDANGQVRSVTVDAEGLRLVTSTTYDGRGRTLTVTDAGQRQTVYTYDALGRRHSETVAGLTTGYFYDPAGNVTARQDAAGSITRFVYDANGRRVYEIDGTGGVTATQYDDAGRLTHTQQYANAVARDWLAGLTPQRVLLPDEVAAQLQLVQGQLPMTDGGGSSSDLALQRIYDGNGRLAFTVDAAHGVTSYRYDENGNLVERRAYAQALDGSVALTYTAIGQNLPAMGDTDRVTLNAYDSRDRLVRQFDAGSLTVFGYDGTGNVVERTAYATQVTSLADTPPATDADRRERMVYDAAGRLVARASAQHRDATGNLLASVERFEYDGAGRVTLHRQHADFLSTASLVSDTRSWIDSLVVDDTRDRVERFRFDMAGRMTRKEGPADAVWDYEYDGADRLQAKIERARRPGAADRMTRSVYDAAGRVQYEIDAEDAVTERRYDGAGRVTKTIRYAQRVSLAGAQLTPDAVTHALQPDATHDRVELAVYDNAGRLRYAVDAEGAVRRTDYDAAGQVQTVTRYGSRIRVWNAAATLDVVSVEQADDVLPALLEGPAAVRVDSFRYDAAGRLLWSRDAVGFTESYQFDALGNKLGFVNKNGATWDYVYDAAGRLLRETGPQVEVTASEVAGSQINVGVTASARIATELAYDALGNLTSRVEAAGIIGQSRTTRYEYDAAGRQIRTIYPAVALDDGDAANAGALERHETEARTLESRVEYDALGNAVAGIDVGGRRSTKEYDLAGRVIREIDVAGGVTRYGRNAFGEVETLTREGAGGLPDRSITTRYDRMGRAKEVIQPLAFTHDRRSGGADRSIGQTTRTDYDAFGDAVTVTGGGTDLNGVFYATGASHFYYDGAGRRVGQLAELDGSNGSARGGYLTTTRYDAEGNALEVTEFATLMADAGDFGNFDALRQRVQRSSDDRTVRAEYDAMNRKSSETREGRYLGTRQADGSVAVDSLTTHYYYDAVGNLTGSIDAAGAVSATRYDALGRRIAVIAPRRADTDGAGAVTPLTEFKLDAYGNVVQRTDYAGGAAGFTLAPLAASGGNYALAQYSVSGADAQRDRRTAFAYDAHGHNTAQSDALGVVTQQSFDAFGRVARSWTPLRNEGETQATQAVFTVNRYDAVGRLTDTTAPGGTGFDAAGNVVADGNATTHTDYNVFGEVDRRTVNGLEIERNIYDAAGRLIATRGRDGVARGQLHDADGRVTQEITNPNRDLVATPGLWADNRVTETIYDSLGNAVERIEAADGPTVIAQSREQIAFVQVEVVHGADGRIVYENVTQSSDGTPVALWSGTNELAVTWPSLEGLGGGDVKVEVDYASPILRAGDAVILPSKPGQVARIFESWQAIDGAHLSWNANNQDQPGIDHVTRIRVSKKNNEGQWVTLIDRPGTSAWGAWVTADAPADETQSAHLFVRTLGSTAPFADAGAMERFGDRALFRYDASASGAAHFDYEVRFGDTVADRGTAEIVSLVDEIPVAGRPRIVKDSHGIDQFTWTAPPAGTVMRLRARVQPSGEWFDFFNQLTGENAGRLTSNGVTASLALPDLPLGRYDYELLYYSAADADALSAHANGTLTLGPQVAFAPDGRNQLTWAPPADRPNAVEKLELRSVDYSSDSPQYGAWEDVSSSIVPAGTEHGVPLADRTPGALQYRLSFIDGGVAYTDAVAVVYVMPSVVANADGLPQTISWTAPPASVRLDGQSYDVQQVLHITHLENGATTDESVRIESLAQGVSGLSLRNLGMIDGLSHAIQYSLEWRIDALDITLGTAAGHLRYGPSQPVVEPSPAGGGLQLRWTVPADLTGRPMQSQLHVNRGGLGWFDPVFDLSGDGTATLDLSNHAPGDYEFRIDYQGREVEGGPLVPWASNTGRVAVVPQPRFGGAEGAHVLSWTAPLNESPFTPTLVLATADGTPLQEREVRAYSGGRQGVDLSDLAAGDYRWTLSFRRSDGSTLGTASGVVHVVPEPALKAGSGTVLAWRAPQNAWPGRHVEQRIEARVRGTEAWGMYGGTITYDAAAGRNEIDLASLGPGAWDYRFTFVDIDTNETLGQASGMLVSLAPPHAGTVDGFAMPPSTLSWMQPPPGLHAIVKLGATDATAPNFDALPAYQGALTSYTNAAGAMRQGLSLADLPAGDYAYQVEYVLDDGDESFGKVQGRLATAPAAQLTNLPAGGMFAHDTPVLHWAQPTAQVVSTRLALHGTQGDVTITDFVQGDLGTGPRVGADLSSLGSGAYTYTLTFTLASGESLTSTGTFRHLSAARVDGSVLSWDAPPAGTTAVLRWREHDASDSAPYHVFADDPFRDSVSFLLPFDGADGSRTITDASASPINPSVVAGDARISTTQSQFGDSSLRLDGTGDYVSYSSNNDFNLPGDFTIEGWFRPDDYGSVNQHLITRKNLTGAPTSGDWGIRVLASGELTFDTTSTNRFTFADGRTVTPGSWHHFAIVRTAGQVRAYLDGAQSTNSLSISTDFTTTRSLEIGRWDVYGSECKGYLDDIRITKGVGRYATSFTPPPWQRVSLPENRQGIAFSSSLGSVDYDYIVEYQDAAGNRTAGTEGEVRIMPEIAMGERGAYVLSWKNPPAGVAQQFSYRLVGAQPFTVIPSNEIPQVTAGYSSFDLKNTPAGDYEVAIDFTRDGTAWGRSSATVRVIPQASFGNSADAESVLSWPQPAPGITASLQVFRDGTRIDAPLRTDGLSVDFGDRSRYAFGNYTYTLTFTKDSQTFGSTQGSFTIALPPTVALESATTVLNTLGTHLTWSTPPAGSTQTFSWRNLDIAGVQGSATGSQIPQLPGGLSGYDISAMPGGRYAWTLTTNVADGSQAVQEGQLTVVGEPVAGLTSGLVTWPAGASGETARLYVGNNEVAATLDSGRYTYDASEVPAGSYLFSIVYSDGDGAYAQVTSSLSIAWVGDEAGTQTNMAVFAQPLTIAKATGPDGNPTTRVSFAATGGVTTFRYQDSSGWHTVAVATTGDTSTVDVGSLPTGTYAYELVDVNGASYTHSAGTFQLDHAGETFTLPVNNISGAYSNSAGQIRWPLPNHAVRNVTFAWRPQGAAQWNTTYVPYQQGSEFVVDAQSVPAGVYDVAITYTGTNPITGDEVWTDRTLGTYTKTETQVPYSYVTYDYVGTEYRNQVDYPHLDGLEVRNLYADNGDRLVFIGIPDPRYTSWSYNGASYTWGTTSLQIGVPTTGTEQFNFGYQYIGLETGNYSGVPYRVSIYSTTGQLLAYTEGSYYDSIGGTAYVVDRWHSYTPGGYYPVYQEVTHSGINTVTSYSYVFVPGSSTTYSDTVGGTPVAPTLTDLTPPPTSPHREYTLFGTQDRYFFRGADPAWRLGTSTVTGAYATSSSARLTQEHQGSGGTLENVQSSARDLSASVQLALSHQQVQDNFTASTSTQIVAGSQRQEIDQSATTKIDRRFGNTGTYSTADATVAGTVPVSLEFQRSWVDASIESHPDSLPSASPTEQRRYDRWGDATAVTDQRGSTTTYSYNAASQVLTQSRPNGSAAASVTTATYDLQGHTASVTDANGHATGMTYDAAGNLIAQVNADGGHVYNRFDAFGDKTETWVQTYRNAEQREDHYSITRYRYDVAGRLTETQRPDAETRVIDGNIAAAQRLSATAVEHWRGGETQGEGGRIVAAADFVSSGATVESYGYDSLGRRTSTTLSAAGVTGEITRTTYDQQGRVTSEQTADGHVTSYTHDALGRKTGERDTSGRVMSWTYEGASQLVATHVGLDGVTLRSTHDFAGELTSEHTDIDRVVDAGGTRMGMHRGYSYDSRGQLTRIEDRSQASVVQVTTYRYDAAGNRTLERTESQEGGHTITVQDNRLRYDAQGRLVHAADGRMSIDLGYDAAGNRTRMTAHYINDSDHQRDFGYGYTYDDMNRMIVEEGVVANDGTVAVGDRQGKAYTYDMAGRRTSMTTHGVTATHSQETQVVGGYDNGTTERTFVMDYYGTGVGDTTERYGYDAAGNLTTITRDGIELQRRRYDLHGRLVKQETPAELADVHVPEPIGTGQDYVPSPPTSGPRGAVRMLDALGYAAQDTFLEYEAGSDRVHLQTVRHVGWDPSTAYENGDLMANVSYAYNGAGNVTSSTAEDFSPYTFGTTDTTNTWRAIGDVERQVSASSLAHRAERTGNVEQRYDGNGHLISLVHSLPTEANPDRMFRSDAMGRVIETLQIDAQGNLKTGEGVREHFTVMRGEQLARSGDAKIDASYVDAFDHVSQFTSQPSVPRQATGARAYVVQDGDTLQSIAQAVYGDGALWYAIAEANGLNAEPGSNNNTSGLRAGMVITLPDPAAIGAGSHSTSSTLRPYDPTEAIGDTAPNLPPPPHDAGCGGVGQAITLIVAVAASFYLGPEVFAALDGATAEVAVANASAVAESAATDAAAAAGTEAAGSAASTLAAAQAEVSTLQASLTSIQFASAAAGAAAGSVAGQIAANAMGIRDGFSFREVVAQALSAGLTSGVPSLTAGLSETAGTMAQAAIRSAVSQGVNISLGLQRSFTWRQVAAAAVAAPISQALGDAADRRLGESSPSLGAIAGRTAYGITSQVLTHAIAGGRVTVAGALSDSFGYQQGQELAYRMEIAAQGQQEEVLGNALGSSVAEAANGNSTRVMGADPAATSENVGQGLREQAETWGSMFNLPVDPLGRTDWSLFSRRAPRLNGMAGGYGVSTSDRAYREQPVDDGVPVYVDAETGAESTPVRPQSVLIGRALPAMAPLPRRGSGELSFGHDYVGELAHTFEAVYSDLDRMAESPSTSSDVRFAAAVVRNPAKWFGDAVTGTGALLAYGLDSQFRSQVNTGIGNFLGNDPLGTSTAAITRYWSENSGLEITRDAFNFAAGGAIGAPLAKLPGMALGEAASLAGRAGELGLRWSRQLADYSFEFTSLNNAALRYQAGAVALTVRNLRAEAMMLAPEGFEVVRISRGAAIMRYGDDYYSVPKGQYSLIPELRAMDTMGDAFSRRVQGIADSFDSSVNLSRGQRLRLDATPEGWLKDKFMSAYKGSYIHDVAGRELPFMKGASGLEYRTVGPDFVPIGGGPGLRYELTQLTPSLNAIFSHTKKYPDQLLRYVTYR